MSGVTVSQDARIAIQIAQWIRNGKPVVAELQNKIAAQLGHLVMFRPRFVFHRSAPLSGAAGGANIPGSVTGTRYRWRIPQWRSGPYAQFVYVQFYLAPQDTGDPTDPYAILEVMDGTGTVIGSANSHWGNSDGTYTDVPINMGGGRSRLRDPSDGVTVIQIDPDTDYWGRFADINYGRLVSAAVWEYSLAPDTDNGYPSTSIGVSGPIFDAHRSDPVAMARTMWKKGGQQLISWCSDTDATAPTQASAGLSGSLSSSIGSVTLGAAGTVGTSAPAFLDSGSFSEAYGVDLEVSSGAEDVNTMEILVVVSDASSISLASTERFTSIETKTKDLGDGEYLTIRAYWRRFAESDGNPVVDVGADVNVIARILTFSGVVTSGVPHQGVTTSGTASATTSLASTASYTTVANELVFVTFGHLNSGTISGWTNASLASVTERLDSNGSVLGIGVATGVDTVAGAISSTTATLSVASEYVSIAFGLKP
jgi:hypothetical protein